MDMQKYLGLFVSEACEHVQAAASEMNLLAGGAGSPERLHALFRHFHSIKGMAASMGFEPIAALSHSLEEMFDRLRKGRLTLTEPVADLVLEAIDLTTAMVGQAAGVMHGTERFADPAPLSARLARVLDPAGAGPKPGPDPAHADAGSPAAGAGGPAGPSPPAAAAGRRLFRCRLAVDVHAQLPGPRAAVALRRLEEIGRIVSCRPPRETLGRPEFPGEISLLLATDRSDHEVLARVKDLLDIQRFEVREEAPEAGEGPAPTGRPEGGPAEPAPSTVRVPAVTLDRLLDAVSEMIARRGAVAEAIRSGDPAAAGGALERLSRCIDDLREHVMLIRLLPFEHITPRLARTVRELCRVTGKRVALRIAGSEVSLDRSVLEELVDPLTHILRNAVDHGVESSEEREAAGKPPAGCVVIEVVRAGGQVTVSVEDDGRGMDLEGIRRRAAEGGYATGEELAAMDPQSLLMLTTIPGFSTAAAVTEVSGRGVGMDVVRTRVEAVGGHVRIASRRGLGTRIEMTLPLTVAVIDAFLVGCRTGVYAVPASGVASVCLAHPARIRTTVSGCYLAGEGDLATLTPLVRLEEALGLSSGDGERPPGGVPPRDVPILTCRVNGGAPAIAVDDILDRRSVVVKPLGTPLEKLRRYSGAALLEDGGVALVLDLASLTRP